MKLTCDGALFVVQIDNRKGRGGYRKGLFER